LLSHDTSYSPAAVSQTWAVTRSSSPPSSRSSRVRPSACVRVRVILPLWVRCRGQQRVQLSNGRQDRDDVPAAGWVPLVEKHDCPLCRHGFGPRQACELLGQDHPLVVDARCAVHLTSLPGPQPGMTHASSTPPQCESPTRKPRPPSMARLVWQKPVDGSESPAIAEIRWQRTLATFGWKDSQPQQVCPLCPIMSASRS
jgi:hypothetical protein